LISEDRDMKGIWLPRLGHFEASLVKRWSVKIAQWSIDQCGDLEASLFDQLRLTIWLGLIDWFFQSLLHNKWNYFTESFMLFSVCVFLYLFCLYSRLLHNAPVHLPVIPVCLIPYQCNLNLSCADEERAVHRSIEWPFDQSPTFKSIRI